MRTAAAARRASCTWQWQLYALLQRTGLPTHCWHQEDEAYQQKIQALREKSDAMHAAAAATTYTQLILQWQCTTCRI